MPAITQLSPNGVMGPTYTFLPKAEAAPEVDVNTTAIPELIAQQLLSRLGQITTGNGYTFNATDVQRVNRDGADFTPKHHAIVLVQGDEERNTEHDYAAQPPANAYNLPFMIHGFIRQADRSTIDDDTLVNEMLGQVQQAVANSNTWHQMDGNSYNTDFGNQETFRSVDHAGFTLELTVQYRIAETDPYTLKNDVN